MVTKKHPPACKIPHTCGTGPTHNASGASHIPGETELAGTEAGFPTRFFFLREPCIYHMAPLSPHLPPTTEVRPLQPLLFDTCKHNLSGPLFLSLLQLSPIYHRKISLLSSFPSTNSGMSPKPLSPTDSPQRSAYDTPSERQRETCIL